jgi:hygromycin-B 7''-O-kinase
MPDDVLLPAVRTLEQFEAVRRDDARLRPGVTAICDRLGLRGLDLVRFPDGSMPVYAVGDQHVLKLYPSVYRREGEVEHRVLQAVEGRLPTPTPRVQHVGEFDGWGYVLMDRLHGASLAAAWPRIGQRGRARLAAQLGETLAALHATTSPVLTWLGPPDWDRFVLQQRTSCLARQRAGGLDAAWLAQIPAFLDRVALDRAPRLALLHTEVMREHLLVTSDADGWSLSGLVDFEPAMRGAREYEFAAVGLFVSRGDAGFLRRLLTAYGYAPAQLDNALPRRLLAYALLHRLLAQLLGSPFRCGAVGWAAVPGPRRARLARPPRASRRAGSASGC